MLEFDNSVCEFGTYSLFNFDQSEELKVTGKRFPKQGLLRCVSASSLSGFGFLADDSLFCWVQLLEVQEMTTAMAANKKNVTKNPRKQPSATGSMAKMQSGLELKQ